MNYRSALVMCCIIDSFWHCIFDCLNGFELEMVLSIFLSVKLNPRAVRLCAHSEIVRGWALAAISVMPMIPDAIHSEDLKKSLTDALLFTVRPLATVV